MLFSFLYALPGDAVGNVGEFDALGLQLVADLIGKGEVLRLFRGAAGFDLFGDRGVLFSALGGLLLLGGAVCLIFRFKR